MKVTNDMEKLKEDLYQFSEAVRLRIKNQKRALHKTSDSDLEAHIEERVALERVAALLTTAGYIIDRLTPD